MTDLILLPDKEFKLRIEKIRAAALEQLPEGVNIDSAALLLGENASLFWLTGRVYAGWCYLPLDHTRKPLFLVRRPVGLGGERVVEIHKPEDIPARLQENGLEVAAHLGLELSLLPYAFVERVRKALGNPGIFNASKAMSVARSVKTPYEIDLIARSGVRQAYVYHKIPELFNDGMTDLELDIAIENLSRLEGCLGQFRISGADMELFMGSILAGDNADEPSPYDFALGGAGQDPSMPVGSCGAIIRPHTTVMVDVNGNYTGYMTDMTRVFSFGEISDEALRAHQCSLDIHHEFCRRAIPGAKASDLYDMALDMARKAGFERYFMGHRQHAGFCGHGVGIEINELPVIAPRSRDILAAGNVIALEPKFVIPGTGAVGIESTYHITPEGAVCLTDFPEEIQPLA